MRDRLPQENHNRISIRERIKTVKLIEGGISLTTWVHAKTQT